MSLSPVGSPLAHERAVRPRARSTAVGLAADGRGIVTVEFALMVPIMVFLLIGLLDYGSVINRKMELVTAIQSGLQYALGAPPVNGDVAAVVDAVGFAAPPDETGTRSIDAVLFCECPGGGTIDCTDVCSDGNDRQVHLSIDITEEVDFLVGYPLIGETIRIGNSGSIRLY